MRKLHISIAVSLLLLLVQQGAVLHEMSHMCRVGTVAVSVKADSGILEKACDLCLAFSQVANPAANTVTIPFFEPTACAAGSDTSCATTPAAVLTPRSRGPPASALS